MDHLWRQQDAKARFSELLKATVAEGPQIITKRGEPAAVLVSIEHWRRLSGGPKPDLKALLLAREPKTEELALPRCRFRYREATP